MTRDRARGILIAITIGVSIASTFAQPVAADEGERALSLSWDKEMLTIRGKHLPGGAARGVVHRGLLPAGFHGTGLEADGHPPQDGNDRIGQRWPAHQASIATR